MHDRRDFFKTTVAAASILAISSIPQAFAAVPAMYTNVIYTKDNPGIWAGKEDSHAPEVMIMSSKVDRK